MKNKTVKIALLAALLLGSICLIRRNKKTQETVKVSRTGVFEIKKPGKENESTVFWQEDDKYYSQGKTASGDGEKKEITKSEYEKNHTAYLN